MAFGGQPAAGCFQVRGVLMLSMPLARCAYHPRTLMPPLKPPGCKSIFLLRLLPRFHRPGLHRDSLRFQPLPSSFRNVMTVRARAEVLAAVAKPVQEQLVRNGIVLPSYSPGTRRGICPECQGGSSREPSLAVTIPEEHGEPAIWLCHRATCGWKGSTWKGSSLNGNGAHKVVKTARRPGVPKEHTAESLRLEAVQQGVLSYFKKRGLSEATIRENNVGQHRINATDVAIAFPYVQDGKILNCKYRDANKRFWQVKDSLKVLITVWTESFSIVLNCHSYRIILNQLYCIVWMTYRYCMDWITSRAIGRL